MSVKTIDLESTTPPPDLQQLLILIQDGSEVVLKQGDMPVARLIPASSRVSEGRVFDLHPASMQMDDDFDEPFIEG